MKRLSNLFSFFLFNLLAFNSFCQTTPISGIINSYTAVNAITLNGCQTSITVNSTAGFLVGDTVMIIQMKGASIDSTSTTSTFGNVSSLNAAGRYELFGIDNITGLQISFNGMLNTNYDINGFVQLVKIPVYNSANVIAPLSCSPWNGQTGGVISFIVKDTLTLNADINADGKGFRGGNISNNPDGSCGSISNGFYYDLNQPGLSWITGGAMKGEGISTLSTLRLAGKGHLANGGGGGNKHNTGGGGGSNYTTGGKGGNELQGCTVAGNGGLGGEAIAYASAAYKLLVLGGGGGCGDYNNNVGSDGTNGGGIVLIKAPTIVGNNHTISTNGADNLVLAGGISDGAGGGGAGGTLMIETQNYSGNLNMYANGGHGGDQGPGSFYGCSGPGGGGGAGIIMISGGGLPPNVSTQMNPGTSGLIQNPSFTCYNTPYGASDGLASAVSFIPNIAIQYVAVSSGGTLVNLGPDTLLCEGQTLLLHASVPFVSYSWQNSSSDSTFLVTSSGTYHVTTVNAAGCVSSDTINVNYISTVLNLGNDTTLCDGETLMLSTPFTAGTTYDWQDHSNLNSFLVTQAGTYWLTIANAGCTASDTIDISYQLNPTVDLGNDTIVCPNTMITLNAFTPNATYLWQNNTTNSTLNTNQAGLYWVEVTVDHCSDRDSMMIVNKDSNCNCNVYIPNAFSPNNDLNNDEFRLVNTDQIELVLFRIYNRWGQLVFETDNEKNGWNGMFKSTPAENGTYFYLVQYRCMLTNTEMNIKGDINLLR